jgi:hypothetical protein
VCESDSGGKAGLDRGWMSDKGLLMDNGQRRDERQRVRLQMAGQDAREKRLGWI